MAAAFASASWALLPLVARGLVNGGPQAFGILVASLGIGAVAGALLLPKLQKRLSRDVLVAGASALYAFAMLALSFFDRLWPLAGVLAAAGVAWLSVLSSLQVAAQMALPNWVRSRGLAVFMAAFMGSMELGSLLWGRPVHGPGTLDLVLPTERLLPGRYAVELRATGGEAHSVVELHEAALAHAVAAIERFESGGGASFKGNTKHRSRRIMIQSTVPGFGRKTEGTVALRTDPSCSSRSSTRLSCPM